jgi:hypothetical protein
MPQLADEVVVGSNGSVYVAPVGTALPTNIAGALNAAFKELGYVSEDGITFTNGQEVEDILAWQSFYPLRKVITSKTTSVQFVLRQWNEDTVKLAFGGGTISRTAGITTYTPPDPSTLDERAMIITWIDGSENYRLVIPRGLVTGEVESNVVRSAAADLPISFDVTPSGIAVAGQLATQPWYLITDSTAFVLT